MTIQVRSSSEIRSFMPLFDKIYYRHLGSAQKSQFNENVLLESSSSLRLALIKKKVDFKIKTFCSVDNAHRAASRVGQSMTVVFSKCWSAVRVAHKPVSCYMFIKFEERTHHRVNFLGSFESSQSFEISCNMTVGWLRIPLDASDDSVHLDSPLLVNAICRTN